MIHSRFDVIDEAQIIWLKKKKKKKKNKKKKNFIIQRGAIF